MTKKSPVDPTEERGRAGRRVRLVGGLLFAIGLALLAAGLFSSRPAAAQDAVHDPATGDVVVQFDDNSSVIRAITFTPPISGMTALTLSGLDVEIAHFSWGAAVCSIQGVGCPATDCFCNSTSYWGYSYWDGSAWQPWPVGAGDSVITQTGAIEGWRWGAFGDPMTPVTQTLSAQAGLGWLRSTMSSTSTVPATNVPAGPSLLGGATAEAMLAVGSNQIDAADWPTQIPDVSLETNLALVGAGYSKSSAGAAGKMMAGAVAAHSCIPSGSLSPTDWYSPTLGAYSGDGTGDNAWAMLGVEAMGEAPPAEAIATLRALQLDSGGWEWSPGWGADTNSTALAIQALIGAGEPLTSSVIVTGVAWLASVQNEDGGFPYSAPGSSDSNSTAYVTQALMAAGEDVRGSAWTQNGHTPIDYLLGNQLGSGAFVWQADLGANRLSTEQAAVALLGRPFPIVGDAPAICAITLLPNAALLPLVFSVVEG